MANRRDFISVQGIQIPREDASRLLEDGFRQLEDVSRQLGDARCQLKNEHRTIKRYRTALAALACCFVLGVCTALVAAWPEAPVERPEMTASELLRDPSVQVLSPNGVKPLTEENIKESGVAVVPGQTQLPSAMDNNDGLGLKSNGRNEVRAAHAAKTKRSHEETKSPWWMEGRTEAKKEGVNLDGRSGRVKMLAAKVGEDWMVKNFNVTGAVSPDAVHVGEIYLALDSINIRLEGIAARHTLPAGRMVRVKRVIPSEENGSIEIWADVEVLNNS